jgi:hypothetical protein
MAVSSQQIIDFLLANPGMTDAQIAAAMQEYNVTPAQMAQAVGLPTEAVQERYVAAAPNTYTAENVNKLASQILSQGTTEAWTGGLPPEKAALYMADELAKSGVTNITQVAKGEDGIINSMTGEKLISGYGERTGGNLWSGSYEGKGNTGFGVNFDEQGNPVFYTQGASSSTLKKDILKLAAVAGAAYGLTGGFEGLLGGASTVGTTGLTASELAAYDLALGGAGGTLGAETLAAALTTGAVVPTLTNLTGGSGLLTGAAGNITADSVAAKLAADAATQFELLNAGASAFTDVSALPTTPTPTTFTPPAVTPNTIIDRPPVPPVVPTTPVPPIVPTTPTPPIVPTTPTPPVVPTTPTPPIVPTLPTNLLSTGLTAAQIGSLLSGGLTTGAGLLQQQTSKEAAQRAQAMIDAETAAAKQAAQFRPVGMTTRFGTSQFTVDPVTGQLTSAGYTLDPQAKNAQDRFVALAEQGLQQAEGAQQQFAPLQTGAQSLFNLGNQYLAQSPQQVAQNYLNQQMALLQPGRELELANLQNKLQQQGRGGLAVSQGGSYGATTPELQALYNARAMQEAQLAAQAQQAGQQQVQFGAGLLGTGAQTMGQYYAGQQAAYAPYTTALGQVQALETAAQQPLTMGASLGQQSSAAGARAGALGLEGANISQRLATGAAATNNPYASLLSGAASNPAFNQLVGGLFSSTPAITAMSAPATTFGTGSYYGNQDLGLFL